ncbi:diguanylate cyclase (GGDEF)-like protein [Anoxybacillus mongoliensis]|uniref:Diguanylate cyclase (GGDEF)-like protein n=1 Tax=Anoxybacillus mongoliensis TaxID=452565 RepID=A0A7W8JBQ0_9BACL|nr:diguanylate cyclase [Anoxybacillus mongoliensis]MBB5354081.1 diguanylate cyclase (GGDEF)-like protein [Anoxybacillus mongoliensis]
MIAVQTDVKVLYVEDEPGAREMLTRLLKRRIRDVKIAKNGQEALELFTTFHPDIVITDIKMPILNGLELIRRIREMDKHVQIIITTAYDDNDFFIRAIEYGVNHFILKPIDHEKFLQSLQHSIYQRQLERELEKQKQYTRTIIDFQENLICILNDERLLDCNLSFQRFFGREQMENLRAGQTHVCDYFVHEPGYFYIKGERRWLRPLIDRTIPFLKVKMMCKQAKEHVFLVKATSFPDEPESYLVVFTDITALEEESKRNEFLATKDPLTKTFNRLKFDEFFTREIHRAKRYKHTFSIILFDIDHFKKVNDTYGHDVGDAVLVRMCETISNRLRDCDILARWGGEEFIILAPATSQAGAYRLAEALRHLIATVHFPKVGHITCSFGVCEYEQGMTKEQMVKRADEALYEAKRTGRNRVVVSECIC